MTPLPTAQRPEVPEACHPVRPAGQAGQRASWGPVVREVRHLHARSLLIGVVAGATLAGVFVAVVAGTAGWEHLNTQFRNNWWLLLPLLAGFTTQVTLMVELRRRHRAMHAAAVSVGAGAGVSGVGMVACCAHHLADLAPVAGATGFATFLTDAQRPLMTAGLAFNVVAVVYAARLLRRVPVVKEGS